MTSEHLLRLCGWVPVSEYLRDFKASGVIVMLGTLDSQLHQQVCDVLDGYAEGASFFNTETMELTDAGSWKELETTIIGTNETTHRTAKG
jgi:hypothetical protein